MSGELGATSALNFCSGSHSKDGLEHLLFLDEGANASANHYLDRQNKINSDIQNLTSNSTSTNTTQVGNLKLLFL